GKHAAPACTRGRLAGRVVRAAAAAAQVEQGEFPVAVLRHGRAAWRGAGDVGVLAVEARGLRLTAPSTRPQRTLREGLLTGLPPLPLSRGGRPVCCVRMRPLEGFTGASRTGATALAATGAEVEFLRR